MQTGGLRSLDYPARSMAGKMAANFMFLILVELILLHVFAGCCITSRSCCHWRWVCAALATVDWDKRDGFSAVAEQARPARMLLPLYAACPGAVLVASRSYAGICRERTIIYGLVNVLKACE